MDYLCFFALLILSGFALVFLTFWTIELVWRKEETKRADRYQSITYERLDEITTLKALLEVADKEIAQLKDVNCCLRTQIEEGGDMSEKAISQDCSGAWYMTYGNIKMPLTDGPVIYDKDKKQWLPYIPPAAPPPVKFDPQVELYWVGPTREGSKCQAMLAVAKSCQDAGLPVPLEVLKFFGTDSAKDLPTLESCKSGTNQRRRVSTESWQEYEYDHPYFKDKPGHKLWVDLRATPTGVTHLDIIVNNNKG